MGIGNEEEEDDNEAFKLRGRKFNVDDHGLLYNISCPFWPNTYTLSESRLTVLVSCT